ADEVIRTLQVRGDSAGNTAAMFFQKIRGESALIAVGGEGRTIDDDEGLVVAGHAGRARRIRFLDRGQRPGASSAGSFDDSAADDPSSLEGSEKLRRETLDFCTLPHDSDEEDQHLHQFSRRLRKLEQRYASWSKARSKCAQK